MTTRERTHLLFGDMGRTEDGMTPTLDKVAQMKRIDQLHRRGNLLRYDATVNPSWVKRWKRHQAADRCIAQWHRLAKASA